MYVCMYVYIYTYIYTIFRKNDKILKKKWAFCKGYLRIRPVAWKRFIEILVGTCSRPCCIFCVVSITRVVVPLSAFLRLISLFALSISRASLYRVERLSFLVWKSDRGNLKFWRFLIAFQCHWWLWWRLPVWFDVERVGLACWSANIYCRRI